MAYFNFEDLTKFFPRDSVLRIFRVAVFVALAVIVGLIVYFQQRGLVVEKEKDKEAPLRERELTNEQKIFELESLSAPADAPQYTREEKMQILEELTPVDQPILSIEEKKAILRSLSAPGQ